MEQLTLLQETPAQRQSRTPTPRLLVRQRGVDRESVLSLQGEKCSIGSSPRCQICLPASEARPLQCVIAFEGDALVAIRWAAGVLLNGREFAKAALVGGDVLAIGSWEIEVNGLAEAEESSVEWAEAAVNALLADALDDGPYAPAPTASSEPASDAEPPRHGAEFGPPSRRECTPSQTFADRVVQWLWTANFQARRRSRRLIAAVRAARFQADVLNADLAAMETELDLARAAYDSRTETDDRLHEAAAEERRLAEERVAPLVAEIAELRQHLEREQNALAESSARCDRLHADLAGAHSRDEQVVASLLAETVRAAELEAEHAERRRELEELGQSLERTHIELANSIESLALRTAELDRLNVDIAECRGERDNLQSELFECRSERDRLQFEIGERLADRDGLHHELAECRAERDRLAELHQSAATRVVELEQWQCTVETNRSAAAEGGADVEGLHLEIATCRAERDRLAELVQSSVARVSELEHWQRTAEENISAASAVRVELESLRLEVAECRAERDRLAELHQSAASRVDELEHWQRNAEANLSAADEVRAELDRLQHEIFQCRADRDELAEQHHGAAARVAELEQWQRDAEDNCAKVAEIRDALDGLHREVAECRADRDRLAELHQGAEARVAELAELLRSAEANRFDAAAPEETTAATQDLPNEFSSSAEEWAQTTDSAWPTEIAEVPSQPTATWGEEPGSDAAFDLPESSHDSHEVAKSAEIGEWGVGSTEREIEGEVDASSNNAAAAESDWRREDVEEAAVEAQPTADSPNPHNEYIAEEKRLDESTPSLAFPSSNNSTSADDVGERPEQEFASTSFIEKYRHLLDDDSTPKTTHARRDGALLDDEYLSPAKVETAAPDNDSDAALEAYMASMMSRVRGGAEPSQATSRASQAPPAAAPLPAIPDEVLEPLLPLEPLDLESLKLGRRLAPPTDLAALRQIANVSARTAIASSHERRTYETALIKMVIAASFMFLSAFLMASAPQVDSWWFWGGAASATVGLGAAVQVLWLERGRAASRKGGKSAADLIASILSAPALAPEANATTEVALAAGD